MLIGDKVKFFDEKLEYTIQAYDGMYVILTRPFYDDEYVYTVVDRQLAIRGPINLIFGPPKPVTTMENVGLLLQWISDNYSDDETCVSRKHRVKLTEHEIKQIGGKVG